MATIYKEFLIDVDPAAVWDALRDVGAAHERLFRGVLVDAHMDGDARVVTFANGLVLRELIVTIDDEARRFVYASIQGRATHHNASFQVFADGKNRSRVVWITDVLPAELVESITQLMETGSQAMKQTLESQVIGHP
jgi:carbon monoxide dehydrogenase subunit G